MRLHHIPASERASSPRESTPSGMESSQAGPPPPPPAACLLSLLLSLCLSWSNNTIVVHQRGHRAGGLVDRNKLGDCHLYFRCGDSPPLPLRPFGVINNCSVLFVPLTPLASASLWCRLPFPGGNLWSIWKNRIHAYPLVRSYCYECRPHLWWMNWFGPFCWMEIRNSSLKSLDKVPQHKRGPSK